MTEEKKNMTGLKERNPHINRNEFCDWLAGEMDPRREKDFLGHIGSCTFCADQFAGWMELPEDLMTERTQLPHEPPRYLKEEILQRTQQMNVQVSVQVKEKSHQMQLLMYSLKVGLAVMTSIFLLMLTSSVRDVDTGAVRDWKIERMQQSQENIDSGPSITDTLNQKSGEISSFLNEMSNGLFHFEEETNNQEVTR